MSDPKSNDPGPEVRKNIVDDIMKKVVAKDPKDTKDQAELDELLKVKQSAKVAVLAKVHPLVENAKMLSVRDPMYIHSDTGRAILFMQIQRLYLEELRKLNREEAIFLLALAWSEFTLNDFV